MTHDLIDRMVRQANPVPDLKVLEAAPASVLELQRRTDMQTENQIEVDPQSNGPNWNLWLAIAAIAAVVIGALFLLRPGPTAPVVDQPEVPATTTPIETTTPPEAATTVTQAADAVPPELEGVWYVDEGNQGITRLVLGANSYSFPQFGAGGRISVTGELAQLSDDLTCPSLAETDPVILREAMGLYRWSIQGTTLTFTAVEPDDCSARESLFAAPFTRNSNGQPDAATTTAPVEDAAPPELEGVWSTDLGGTLGINRLIIRGTTYNLSYAGVGGQISVDGDLIEFSDNGLCSVTGVYRWLVEGDTLAFTAVEPPVDCSERRGFLVGGDGVTRV